MCFNINPQSKKEKTLWQATEDIVCYKKVTKKNKKLYGYYQDNFRYITGKLLTAPLLIPKNGNLLVKKDFEISEGFHSIKNLKKCRYSWYYPLKNTAIAQFIIPKGAFFYENDEEYVSNQIILIKTLKS